MNSRNAVLGAVALCAAGGAANIAHAAVNFRNPSHYTSFSDSPWASESSDLIVEDFEDGLLNSIGLTASAGNVRAPSMFTDSVDFDDNVMDGLGRDGHSFLTTNAVAGITFSFNAAELGSYPTIAGLVWTDGNWQSIVTLEAWDTNGVSLGTRQYIFDQINDGTGQTDEDRFIGAEFEGGISAIRIWGTLGGLEVDHVQYGHNTIPVPGSLALLGAAGIVGMRRRRRV